MPDKYIDIFRRGLDLEYTPPEAVNEVPDRTTEAKEEEAGIEGATLSIRPTDLRQSYTSLIARIESLRDRLDPDSVNIVVPIEDAGLVALLGEYGYEGTLTIQTLREMRTDSRLQHIFPQLVSSYHDKVLSWDGNHAPLVWDDLMDTEDILRKTLDELIKSEFYGAWIDEDWEAHWVPESVSWRTGREDYFDHQVSYYWAKGQLAKNRVDRVQSYLELVPWKLSRCLWENLVRKATDSKELREIIDTLRKVSRTLKVSTTALMVAYTLPNLSISGFLSQIKDRILDHIIENLERSLAQVAYNMSRDLANPIFELTEGWEDDVNCPLFTQLNMELGEILQEELLDLRKAVNRQLQFDREVTGLNTEKYDLLEKKKKLRNLIHTLQSISSVLDRFIQTGGALEGEWFDRLFNKAFQQQRELTLNHREVREEFHKAMIQGRPYEDQETS
jgi:hypothetical protein